MQYKSFGAQLSVWISLYLSIKITKNFKKYIIWLYENILINGATCHTHLLLCQVCDHSISLNNNHKNFKKYIIWLYENLWSMELSNTHFLVCQVCNQTEFSINITKNFKNYIIWLYENLLINGAMQCKSFGAPISVWLVCI
jgi:hypothetical protein